MILNRLLALTLFFIITYSATAQTVTQKSPVVNSTDSDRPKLVVGLVIDQMRWDFLYRYADKYGSTGFKRLMREGYNCQNTHINYIPSYTACGHTCIYTGSVPALHGIVGNEWYVREAKARTYCTDDTAYKIVGIGGLKGNTSPRNLITTTITDELRLATNFQSKVIALSLKDRSSVLPGGHTANGVYFMDYAAGNFISTTYYMKELPNWVTKFNEQKLVKKYIDQNWATLLPLEQYIESTDDDMPFERAFKGEDKPVFVHKTSEIFKVNPEVIVNSPYGNQITLEFAKAAIAGENLGKNTVTDFLAVSLSSTDYIGHQFGPNSIEIEDCYLKLDKELGSFLTYLDEKVGKGNYMLFLTADHGAAHATGFLQQHGIPAGSSAAPDSVRKNLNAELSNKFGTGEWVETYDNMQVYLNEGLMADKKIAREDLFETIRSYMMKQESVANVIDLHNLSSSTLQSNLKELATNGYNAKRSGDIQIFFNPGWIEGYTKGTSHGTAYPYDTHIPLIFYGWKVPHVEDSSPTYMTDIAPTVAQLLHIQEPNGTVGKPIRIIVK